MTTPLKQKRISENTIEEVKQRADLIDVISEHIVLRKSGKDYMGLCPFHEEKTPSFSISPGKQLYHCFGCNASGDAIKFLMELGKQSFTEAVTSLAYRYNIPLGEEAGRPAKAPNSRLDGFDNPPQQQGCTLARLLAPATDSPQPQKPQFYPKGVPSNAASITYEYDDSYGQRGVTRFQWEDTSNPKGHSKTFRQWHVGEDGKINWTKGEPQHWYPYRWKEALDAVEQTSAQTKKLSVLLVQDGEECVEVARRMGTASITFQGSGWNPEEIADKLRWLKFDAGDGERDYLALAFLKDNDKNQSCEEKAKKLQSACDSVGIIYFGIDPLAICPDLPDKGDIVQILERMDPEEFIQRLEAEIHKAVAAREEKQQASYAALELPLIDPKQKLPLKKAVQMARAILQEGGSELDINIRLEELRELSKMGSYAWDQKIIKPLRRELEAPRLKLELAAILQEPDQVERLRLLAALSPKYSMSASALSKALRVIKARQETAETKVFNLADFLAMESEGLQWLVPGLLPKGETILLAGPPKGGKSLMATDLAFAIAVNEDYFLGEQLPQGKVLLISVDESAASTKAKLLKRGFRPEDQGIRVITSWDMTQMDILERELENFRPDVTIIDSLKRITKGSNLSENSAEFADNIYDLKETLTRYGSAGVLIHHTSKSPDLLGVHQVRGSSAISGAVWGHWLLNHIPKKVPNQNNRLKVDPADPMRVLTAHTRDSEGQELRIELNPENNSWISHGQMGEANAAEQQSLKLRVLNVLTKNSHRAWTGREIINLLGMTPEEGRGIYTTLNRLVERREINCRPSPTGRGQVYSVVTDENPLPPPSPPPTDSVLNSIPESIAITASESIQHQFNINSTELENTPLLSCPNDLSASISGVGFNNLTPQGGEGVELFVESCQSELFEQQLDGDFVALPVSAKTEQLNLLTAEVGDSWTSEQNLQDMADSLAQCDDAETLAALRECWPPYAMNAACKLLTPAKHEQIRQWVIELNA